MAKATPACCFAILFLAFRLPLHAQQPATSIEVVETFDYPRQGTTRTQALGISNGGIAVGSFQLPDGSVAGYRRNASGRFSPPISFPGATSTSAEGTNVSGVVCGWVLLGYTIHGFFYDGQTYTQYDPPGSVYTFIYAENDNGDFVGTADTPTQSRCFVNIAGIVTLFEIPGALITTPFGINNADQIVGSYGLADGTYHGFLRDAQGKLHFPIDFPGSTNTYFQGINDRQVIVGGWDDGGPTSAFVLEWPNRWTQFADTDGSDTYFQAVNDKGLIAGWYFDFNGLYHGLIARLVR